MFEAVIFSSLKIDSNHLKGDSYVSFCITALP
jgi:hypothetical protein